MNPRPPQRWPQPWIAAGVVGLAACSGRGPADPGFSPGQGELVEKPGGGYFLSDPHHGGKASRVRLLEIGWGRLVDVHDVDTQGATNPLPVLRDVVIGENVLTDGVDLRLETHPITHESRLVVLHPRDAPDTGAGSFTSVLARASAGLGSLLPKHDDGTALPPFSYTPRNGTLVLRFDDLLEDGPDAREALFETVRLTTGYPPITPHPARIVFDPSHGGLASGVFHSTRVLVDFSVSEREALELPVLVPINASGLPASSRFSDQASASLHLPTRLDASLGRFVRLTNLAGRGLAAELPIADDTQDLVRAFRTGNDGDVNSGFLLDLAPPSIVASWEILLEDARDDPLGPPGHGFRVDLAFRTPCRAAPRVGDTLELAGELYEVRTGGPGPDPDGRVRDLRVLRLESEPLLRPDDLVGIGRHFTPYRAGTGLDGACWLTFVPPPGRAPFEEIAGESSVHVRFSEPMNPSSFRAFDTFRVLRGAENNEPIRAEDLVVGAVRVEQNLQEFSFIPRLPFANHEDTQYRFELVGGALGVRDLSGSALSGTFQRTEFVLTSAEPPRANGGFALRFQTTDEIDPSGAPDVRGQVSYDEDGGVLRPRPTAFSAYAADRGNPVPNLMLPFAPGVQTPLSPLGSKLQALWRYVDFGYRVRDEAFHNLDVVGLWWSPVGGTLVSDFYPLFELRLGHSLYLPDESGSNAGGPVYPSSGLPGRPSEFTENLLDDPLGDQVVVHPRGLGYRLRPSDLTVNGRGTPLAPFPWNRGGGPLTSYTWRDTRLLGLGGSGSPGIPLDIEVGAPLRLEPVVGEVAESGRVPSIGLPLLWEVRCFPSAAGIGLNAFEIMLPLLGWAQPNFRAFSTGGIDRTGAPVLVDPDLELYPNGGFNPNSSPPGRPTALTADNSFYVGQIETVVRVSRAVTIWIDSGNFGPRYVESVVEPRTQIGATGLVVEYRGAHSFSPGAGSAPFDASQLDPYGDFRNGTVDYLADESWSEDVHSADGARFIQVRFTFLNDIANSLSPELDSFGLAFEE